MDSRKVIATGDYTPKPLPGSKEPEVLPEIELIVVEGSIGKI